MKRSEAFEALDEFFSVAFAVAEDTEATSEAFSNYSKMVEEEVLPEGETLFSVTGIICNAVIDVLIGAGLIFDQEDQ